jgi:OTU domain-containing protein 6
MEELLARHWKEQKDLQGRVTQKKKNATKKTRKGVNDECETLERELKERQQAEINALQPSSLEDAVQNLDLSGEVALEEPPLANGESAKQVRFDENAKNTTEAQSPDTQQKSKKPNRQKERLARRAAKQEAEAAAAAEEAANLPDLREQEMKAMNDQMKQRGVIEIFVQPDGHCLYSACAHGLDAEHVKKSGPYSPPYQNVRYAAADFISQHPDDFAPFLEEPLDTYVKKIKDTAEWGGQLELQAIARAYHVDIHVLQADGRVEKIESGENRSNSKSDDVWLAYYRHSFGLGEHYNALKKADHT